MTFREQVRFARRWGAASVSSGLIWFAILSWWGVEANKSALMDATIHLCTVLVGIGGVLLVFGGVGRPIHRWQWHYAIRHSVLWNRYYPKKFSRGWASPFWRRWLHIDAEGNDLDARP